MKTIEAKKYNFYGVYGLSENQLRQHEKLYEGYVTKLNQVRKILSEVNNYEDSNSIFSKMRSLKLAESYSLNSIKLHELYFENIIGAGNRFYKPIIDCILENYGSVDNFFKRFISVGMAMRGWAVLVWDPLDEALHIIGQDAHDEGSTITTIPLLVLDVYEHAYFIDYGIAKKDYIDIFIRNINWEIVNNRFLDIFS